MEILIKFKKYWNGNQKLDIDKGAKLILKNIDYWSKAPVWTTKGIKIVTKN